VDNNKEDGDEEEYLYYVLKAFTTKEGDMKIETHVPNVGLRGHSLTVWHYGLLMLSIDVHPGAWHLSVKIAISDNDPNKVYVNVDISPSLILPK
jgi:hypothetical protein